MSASARHESELDEGFKMLFLLWILAVVIVVFGLVRMFQGDVVIGIALIVIGFLVGPGGASIFS